MTVNTIIMIFVIVVGLVILGMCVYTYLRNKSIEEIRTDVYHLFLMAEKAFDKGGAGKQKMAWVVSRARLLLPVWLQAFVSDELLYSVFEVWFKSVKDLLDDGKYNHSVKEE